jgi:hypothetical protein
MPKMKLSLSKVIDAKRLVQIKRLYRKTKIKRMDTKKAKLFKAKGISPDYLLSNSKPTLNFHSILFCLSNRPMQELPEYVAKKLNAIESGRIGGAGGMNMTKGYRIFAGLHKTSAGFRFELRNFERNHRIVQEYDKNGKPVGSILRSKL